MVFVSSLLHIRFHIGTLVEAHKSRLCSAKSKIFSIHFKKIYRLIALGQRGGKNELFFFQS